MVCYGLVVVLYPKDSCDGLLSPQCGTDDMVKLLRVELSAR